MPQARVYRERYLGLGSGNGWVLFVNASLLDLTYDPSTMEAVPPDRH